MCTWSMVRLIVTLATYTLCCVVCVGRMTVAVDCKLLHDLVPTKKVAIYIQIKVIG